MKPLITVAAISLGLLTIAADDIDRYKRLRQQAVAMDSRVSFADLRFATVESPQYDPFYCVSDDYRELLAVMESEPLDRALAACQDPTTTQFVSIPLHEACARRLSELGESARADMHRFVHDGLLDSLKPDADGTVTVINVEEEYEFAAWKGYRVIGHAKLKPNRPSAKPISALKVTDEAGEVSWIHFSKHPAYDRIQRSIIRDALDSVD